MPDLPSAELPTRLAARLAARLPGPRAQRRFEPELSFGRHADAPRGTTRRAAVVALLYPRDGLWHLPLTVRPETMPDHAGQICLPGGRLEAGETSPQAALRELHEELGVEPAGVRLLGSLSPLNLFVSDFRLEPWVALVDDAPRFHADSGEVAELLEVPLDHWLDSRHHGEHARQRYGVRYRVPHLEWHGRFVWGATAMILGELLCLLEAP